MLNHIEEVRALNLPAGTYIVAGGSCLDVKGIRPSNDIDMVVIQEAFDILQARGWKVDEPFKEKWGRERLKHGHFEVYHDLSLEGLGGYTPAEELISKAELIDGVAFMTLPDLIFYKRLNGRQKDMDDIALIEQYLETHA